MMMVDPKLNMPSSSPRTRWFFSVMSMRITFKAPTITMVISPCSHLAVTVTLPFFSQMGFPLARVRSLTLSQRPSMGVRLRMSRAVGEWKRWQSPGARQMTSWKSLLFLWSLRLSVMKEGSAWLVPVTSSLKEYLHPLTVWHLSPVTSSTTSTLPSQGEETVFGKASGRGLLILRVKKAQKVGYSLRGSSTYLRLTRQNFEYAVKIGLRSSRGICISAIISVCLHRAGFSLSQLLFNVPS